jgi:hypothetical protein
VTDGRTYWWSKDAAWWRRERVVALGQEFGAAGPAALDYLSCEAKMQNDGGQVKAGWRVLARDAFAESPERAQDIVERAVEIGALDDLVELPHGLFTCRVSGWRHDQDLAQGAERSRRARRASRSDTVRHGPSDFVTRTGQDSTGTENGSRARAHETPAETAIRRAEAAERVARADQGRRV